VATRIIAYPEVLRGYLLTAVKTTAINEEATDFELLQIQE